MPRSGCEPHPVWFGDHRRRLKTRIGRTGLTMRVTEPVTTRSAIEQRSRVEIFEEPLTGAERDRWIARCTESTSLDRWHTSPPRMSLHLTGHEVVVQGHGKEIERLYRITLLRQMCPSGRDPQGPRCPEWNTRATVATHVRALERRLDGEPRLHGRLVHLLASLEIGDGGSTEDLLTILEEMTMLDTNVQRRISTLVYADIESAVAYLERVFGFGPAQVGRYGDGPCRPRGDPSR